ncbi:MAG: c-type cytochrome, partial [Chitinophagales bacterium]
MRKLLRYVAFVFIFALTSRIVSAQEWKDVAPIFYSNCSNCHRQGEIGLFPMMSYSDLMNTIYLSAIPSYVNSGLMPPWKADPNYHHFLDERILSQADKDALTNWVNAGAPAGDTTLAPPPPVFPTGSQIGTPDLVLTMAQPYHLLGNGIDDYECFVLPTNLLQDQDISALEFRSGNGAAVHHVFMYLVTDSSAVYADQQTPEYGYPSFGGAGQGVHADFLGLYAPGMVPRFYPAHGIVTFPAGSFLLIQIHYAPLTYPTTDQSSVNLFFSSYTDPRAVK